MKKAILPFGIMLIVSLLFLALPNLSTIAKANTEITVAIDNRPVYFDVAPQFVSERVMVPVRAIFESLGARVDWDNSTQTVTGIKAGTVIKLTLNDSTATINNRNIDLDVPATQIGGRTFVPARFVAESFGADVRWDGDKEQVVISTGKKAESTYYFVYNSERVDADDLAAIKLYVNKFTDTYNLLFDASGYDTASDIYDALKADKSKRKTKIEGVQIFGLEADVPSFHMTHKLSFIDPKGKASLVEQDDRDIVTDFFYSTFDTDSKYFDGSLNVADIFDKKLPVDMVPDWKVSRLLVGEGEVDQYIEKYYDYREAISGKSIPTVSFSSPTFIRRWSRSQEDDLGYFLMQLKERFQVIKGDFRVYTNKEGDIVSNPMSGVFSVDNLKKENEKGIMDFVFNGHGGSDFVKQTIIMGNSQDKIPFISKENINEILGNNAYTAFLFSCETVKGLNDDSFVSKAMSKGKMISAIAGSYDVSANGMKVYSERMGINGAEYSEVSYDDLKLNNPNYFVYNFYDRLNKGQTRLQSLHDAKTEYATELLKHTDVSKGDQFGSNYQCGFMNILSFQYIGLADY